MPSEESPEAKFDRLKKKFQDSILRDYPNLERKGCPGDPVLRELAERPLNRAVEDDPHWHHITHCSECYREFLTFNNAFRQQVKVRRTRVGFGLGVAAIVLAVGVLVGLKQGSVISPPPLSTEVVWVDYTIIVPSETRSGNASEQKPIVLRRLPLRLTVQLPVGSKAGAYELQLKLKDRKAVSAGGVAAIHNGTTAFAVTVNLSEFYPGNYSLEIRQAPNDWNLYPVVIR